MILKSNEQNKRDYESKITFIDYNHCVYVFFYTARSLAQTHAWADGILLFLKNKRNVTGN